MRAEGVSGGVRRRRDSVVVCDFKSAIHAFVTSRGSSDSAVEVEDVVAVDLDVDADADADDGDGDSEEK